MHTINTTRLDDACSLLPIQSVDYFYPWGFWLFESAESDMPKYRTNRLLAMLILGTNVINSFRVSPEFFESQICLSILIDYHQ